MARKAVETKKGLLALSEHALVQMSLRKIPLATVITVFEDPDSDMPNLDHPRARNLSKTIDGVRYKVGVHFGDGAPEVITAFNWKGTIQLP